MGFKTLPGRRLRGSARYVEEDYSIVFDVDETDLDLRGLSRDSIDCALLAGTLTLAARSADGLVLFPEGYHPRQSWIEGTVVVPAVPSGSLYWEVPSDLVQGGALGIAELDGVSTTFDPESGWILIRLGADGIEFDDQGGDAVEFCDGVIARLEATRLVALWVHLQETSRV